MISSVLIADNIEQECVDVLRAAGINVTVQTKQTKEQLLESLPKHDAVIVRSATKVGSTRSSELDSSRLPPNCSMPLLENSRWSAELELGKSFIV